MPSQQFLDLSVVRGRQSLFFKVRSGYRRTSDFQIFASGCRPLVSGQIVKVFRVYQSKIRKINCLIYFSFRNSCVCKNIFHFVALVTRFLGQFWIKNKIICLGVEIKILYKLKHTYKTHTKNRPIGIMLQPRVWPHFLSIRHCANLKNIFFCWHGTGEPCRGPRIRDIILVFMEICQEFFSWIVLWPIMSKSRPSLRRPPACVLIIKQISPGLSHLGLGLNHDILAKLGSPYHFHQTRFPNLVPYDNNAGSPWHFLLKFHLNCGCFSNQQKMLFVFQWCIFIFFKILCYNLQGMTYKLQPTSCVYKCQSHFWDNFQIKYLLRI